MLMDLSIQIGFFRISIPLLGFFVVVVVVVVGRVVVVLVALVAAAAAAAAAVVFVFAIVQTFRTCT